MRHSGKDAAAEIPEDQREGLALLGRFSGYLPQRVAGAHIRRDRKSSDVPEIIRHPVDQLVGVVSELFWVHREFAWNE